MYSISIPRVVFFFFNLCTFKSIDIHFTAFHWDFKFCHSINFRTIMEVFYAGLVSKSQFCYCDMCVVEYSGPSSDNFMVLIKWQWCSEIWSTWRMQHLHAVNNPSETQILARFGFLKTIINLHENTNMLWLFCFVFLNPNKTPVVALLNLNIGSCTT